MSDAVCVISQLPQMECFWPFNKGFCPFVRNEDTNGTRDSSHQRKGQGRVLYTSNQMVLVFCLFFLNNNKTIIFSA